MPTARAGSPADGAWVSRFSNQEAFAVVSMIYTAAVLVWKLAFRCGAVFFLKLLSKFIFFGVRYTLFNMPAVRS